MTHIQRLNQVVSGWTETKSGMMVNSVNLDIIDKAIGTDKWFIISDFGAVEGIDSRDKAVEIYLSMSAKE